MLGSLIRGRTKKGDSGKFTYLLGLKSLKEKKGGINVWKGQFMNHVVAYKYTKSDYDDSIDSVSLYVDKFIKLSDSRAKAKILRI